MSDWLLRCQSFGGVMFQSGQSVVPDVLLFLVSV